MPLPNENQLLNLETYILRVHVNCDGCRQKVKKTLRKIEGVYSVNVDVEEQKVTVTGRVDSARLIRKLAKSGKHAKLWSPMSNPDGIEDSDGPGNNRSRQMHHHSPSFHGGEDDTEWWFQRYKNQLLNGQEDWNSETDPGQFEEDHELHEYDAPKIGIQGYDRNRHGDQDGSVRVASNRIRRLRDFPAHLYQHYPPSSSSTMPDSSGYQRYHSDGSWMNDSYSFRNNNNTNPTWAGQSAYPLRASSYGYY